MKNEGVWIFAYGSLCWRPGFEYEEKVLGHIKGHVRRFWQGNTVHRGTIDKPGRVATLISEPHGETDGCAFRVSAANAKKTLRYLENRETNLGGYDSKMVMFYPCDNTLTPVKVILYVALPGNVDWRGPAKLNDIADEVLNATGVCGSNLEYVTDLAAFLRSNRFRDEHLFELEAILLKKLKDLNDSSESLSSSSSEFDADADADVDSI